LIAIHSIGRPWLMALNIKTARASRAAVRRASRP
jgi:hypothetical protein